LIEKRLFIEHVRNIPSKSCLCLTRIETLFLSIKSYMLHKLVLHKFCLDVSLGGNRPIWLTCSYPGCHSMPTFEILKFSLIVRPRHTKQNTKHDHSISFVQLCRLGLTVKLDFNVANMVYSDNTMLRLEGDKCAICHTLFCMEYVQAEQYQFYHCNP